MFILFLLLSKAINDTTVLKICSTVLNNIVINGLMDNYLYCVLKMNCCVLILVKFQFFVLSPSLPNPLPVHQGETCRTTTGLIYFIDHIHTHHQICPLHLTHLWGGGGSSICQWHCDSCCFIGICYHNYCNINRHRVLLKLIPSKH